MAVTSVRQDHCARCKTLFYICSSCDRGQSYCQPACRILARTQSLKTIRKRHQQSTEGRLDHAERQRERRRKVKKTVMDHSSKLATNILPTSTELEGEAPKQEKPVLILLKEKKEDANNDVKEKEANASCTEEGAKLLCNGKTKPMYVRCNWCGRKYSFIRNMFLVRNRKKELK